MLLLDNQEGAVRHSPPTGMKGRPMRLLLILALLWPAIATAEVIASSSIYVVDGDTVRARGDKFRLRQLMASVRNVDLVILLGRDKYNRGLV